MANTEKEIVEKIKRSYTKSNDKTKLEELKSLDRHVKNPAIIFAYIFGTIGALVLGFGMCLAMEVLFDLMPLGIVIGLVGIVMVSVTYPIYQFILNKRKAKYAKTIIAKSDELLNNK